MATTGFRCKCCDLVHQQVGEGLCSVCRYHQSAEINQTVKRHSEHEALLRERLTAASEWAGRADDERKKFGEKMHWALRSRDRCIKILRQVSDLHELRSDLSCKCGKPKGCKIADLLDDRGVQQLIRRVDEFEDEARRREQVWREIQATGGPDEWEDFLRNEGRPAPRPGRQSDTA